VTLDAKQYQQSLALVNCCMSLVFVCFSAYPNIRSSLLYIEVWKIRWKNASISKRRLKLWSITNDLLPGLVIVLWRIIFKTIPSMKEHRCRHSCYSCLVAGKNIVVEIVVVKFVQLSFVNALQRTSIQCPQILLKIVVALLFWSSIMLDVIDSIE